MLTLKIVLIVQSDRVGGGPTWRCSQLVGNLRVFVMSAQALVYAGVGGCVTCVMTPAGVASIITSGSDCTTQTFGAMNECVFKMRFGYVFTCLFFLFY